MVPVMADEESEDRDRSAGPSAVHPVTLPLAPPPTIEVDDSEDSMKDGEDDLEPLRMCCITHPCHDTHC
jgi:hypothetical protein